jgi:hypothetical protein
LEQNTTWNVGFEDRREKGKTVSEKILAAHDIERKGELKPGDKIRVHVD